MGRKRSSFLKKIIVSVFIILFIGGSAMAYLFYQMIYQPNVTLNGKKTEYFYIPTGSSLEEVVNSLYERNYIINRNSFEWVAEKKDYRSHVHPGRYLLKADMSNNQLIDLLRSGVQQPVNITFSSIRTKEQLAGRVTAKLEADSVDFIHLLNDDEFLSAYGFNPQTILAMFIPNTYEFYWNTSEEEFFQRMAKEFKIFWNEERKAKLGALGLSQSEVATLASIVQMETARNKEKPTVAGVYLNRVEKGMLLQADPTVIYACGDFSIRRVLNKHKEIDSPYNTYKYAGLPPGPICLPSISSVDAVLNYEKHDYLYFCAKEDFSGTHVFAKTYTQHKVNARKYRQALNKRKIYN